MDARRACGSSGSKYPNMIVQGPKSHLRHGFLDLIPQYLANWTLQGSKRRVATHHFKRAIIHIRALPNQDHLKSPFYGRGSQALGICGEVLGSPYVEAPIGWIRVFKALAPSAPWHRTRRGCAQLERAEAVRSPQGARELAKPAGPLP